MQLATVFQQFDIRQVCVPLSSPSPLAITEANNLHFKWSLKQTQSDNNDIITVTVVVVAIVFLFFLLLLPILSPICIWFLITITFWCFILVNRDKCKYDRNKNQQKKIFGGLFLWKTIAGRNGGGGGYGTWILFDLRENVIIGKQIQKKKNIFSRAHFFLNISQKNVDFLGKNLDFWKKYFLKFNEKIFFSRYNFFIIFYFL